MSVTLINLRPPGWQSGTAASAGGVLVDSQARRISYLRLSITDRCDLRCTYCMPERMQFLPRSDLLSFDELERLVDGFIARGVTKLRVTGGEPLVRRGALDLLARFAKRLGGGGLQELTLTTNGTQLAAHADGLARIGIRRINASLDTLDRETYARLARRDVLGDVLAGIEAAAAAGIHIKINTVALADANREEIPRLIEWAHARGHDLSLIEIMPLGEDMPGRPESFLSLEEVRRDLDSRWTLQPLAESTGGPSRYVRIAETGGRLGFISPLSHNFCGDCNRVRVTCTGRLYSCLGHEGGADLRAALRGDAGLDTFNRALDAAIGAKPARHDFAVERLAVPSSGRTMSVTGG